MTSATTQAQPDPIGGFAKARHAFRTWRRTRPFWGGLLVLLAAGPILYFPYATLSLGALRIHMATTAGAGSAVIGLLLVALGISVWFQPLIRIFAGIAAIVLSLVSLPVSNMGGFGMGLILGILGGGLVCSWAPLKQPKTAEAVPQPAEAQTTAAAPVEVPVAEAVQAPVEAPTEVLLPTQQVAEPQAAPTAHPQPAQPAEPQGAPDAQEES